mmetsp:Transcript_33238/g.80354  ORF Transcript_33238/g.80354 Transcript_33238/m.80354 type:complete len:537 (-) Transcript_33238:910-2520(-)
MIVSLISCLTIVANGIDQPFEPHDDDDDDNEATTANNITKWLEQAAELLNHQWPRGGSANFYKEKVINEQPPLSNRQQQPNDDDDDDNDDSSRISAFFCGLPSSYVLIQNETKDCIGHGRLTECFESAGGNAAAVTFIVIHSTKQYHGFGRKLMALLEQEAERLGYHYIYLWTKTAIGFYEKIGYAECQRVSLKRACLKKLVTEQVESLEALLVKRRSKINMASNKTGSGTRKNDSLPTVGKKKETILLPPDDDNGNNDLPDVWMKKRLVEQVGSIHVPMDQRISELEEVANEVLATNNGQNSSNSWYYRIVSIPWQAQIGPSCGLAALRMVREYFMASEKMSGDGEEEQEDQLPSLLQEAQERGFTQDGEIFDANHLKEMAVTVCGIDSEISSVPDELTPSKVNAVLAKGGVFILPYDSNGKTKLPGKSSGQKAHYGIIVGIALMSEEAAVAGKLLQPLSVEQEKLLDGDSGDRISQVYLMVQHGLSPNLSIAPWSAFIESNAQLICFDENKFGSAKFKLDLKDRIIVCKGLQQS